MSKRDPRVDVYIAKAAEFAQPILIHIREHVHQACPEAEEAIKWGRPFFLYRGVILCAMAAFKQHCSVMFWGAEMTKTLRHQGALEQDGMGSFGRIATLSDLPDDRKLLRYIRQAAAFVDQGKGKTLMAAGGRAAKAPKPAIQPPTDFLSALKKDSSASRVFAAFSPSCKREYVEWIAEAKRPETRNRRIQQAVEWISEGKQRNWKYMAGAS